MNRPEGCKVQDASLQVTDEHERSPSAENKRAAGLLLRQPVAVGSIPLTDGHKLKMAEESEQGR